MVKMFVFDSDLAAGKTAKSFLTRFFTERHLKNDVTLFSDALTSLIHLTAEGEMYDMILLNAYGDMLSGSDIYQSLLCTSPELLGRILFSTNNITAAIKSLSGHAINQDDIVIKPFKYHSFIRAVAPTALQVAKAKVRLKKKAA